MALKLKYQGQEKSRSKNQSSYKETYYGTEAEVDAKITEIEVGSFTSGKGYLQSWRKSQMQGIFYQLQLDYAITYDYKPDDLADSEVGKKTATLSARAMQLPLQHHPNYQVRWNHYLYAKKGYVLPAWWATLTDIDNMTESLQNQYQWAKYPTDVPKTDSDGNRWVRLKKPTMPGVEVYDYALYTITISAKYRSASAAGEAISNDINTITSPQQDFGLGTGGYNFKLDDISVSYDGRAWIATMTYTRSGDNKGWDTRLYN